MNRNSVIEQFENKHFDLIIIGGGATGLGTALEAVTRGYSVALIDRSDFAKETSSKSTKLVHGGVRYLKNGDIKLVKEALAERAFLLKNAPHLSHKTGFIIPSYSHFHRLFYGIGLKVYDLLSGKGSLGNSRILSKKSTLELLPGVKKEGLKGGVLYFDGQFDDARLALTLARTAHQKGAVLLNYCTAESLKIENGKIQGLNAKDTLTNQTFTIGGNYVVNATGVHGEEWLRQAENQTPKVKLRASRGVHIVLNKEFLPGKNALMVPSTTDGRVLFAVPWYDHLIVGTTDTETKDVDIEPLATNQEIDFILENAGNYLTKTPKRSDVLSVFSGLRPLISAEGKSSKALSRSHLVHISKTGLISVLGGKWTTYRHMAEDAINQMEMYFQMQKTTSVTQHLTLFGATSKRNDNSNWKQYGTEIENVKQFGNSDSLTTEFFISEAQIRYAVEHEWAQKLEDILLRRTRGVFLNVKEAQRIAPKVVEILADALGKDAEWAKNELEEFLTLTQKYTL